jgi:peptidoglycan/LPS O-acetylase OafA/YrhL
LSVALFHLGGAGLPKLSSPLTASLTSWGWTGVEVFFVISGFVIPFVMVKADHQWRDSGTFLVRRFIRIWPPSAILIALTVAQYWVVNHMGHGAPEGWTALSAPGVLANLLYAVPFTGQAWLNGILWTLSVEFQYYLILALIFPLLASSRACLVAAGLASLVTALLPFAEAALFLRYSIFFAMGGLTLLYREGKLGQIPFLALLAAMTATAAAELGLLQTGFAAATALAIAFVPIRNRLFVFLGTISYSLYLVHMLVASTAEFLILRLFAPVSALGKFAAQLACLGIAVLGAWVFYLLVERHFVTLSQRFAGHLRGRRRRQVEKIIPSEGM